MTPQLDCEAKTEVQGNAGAPWTKVITSEYCFLLHIYITGPPHAACRTLRGGVPGTPHSANT